jgi:hypothetical protein
MVLQHIRNQPKEKRIRIIWICAGIMVIVLLLVWALTAHVRKNTAGDTSLFQTLDRGFNDFKDNYNKPIK